MFHYQVLSSQRRSKVWLFRCSKRRQCWRQRLKRAYITVLTRLKQRLYKPIFDSQDLFVSWNATKSICASFNYYLMVFLTFRLIPAYFPSFAKFSLFSEGLVFIILFVCLFIVSGVNVLSLGSKATNPAFSSTNVFISCGCIIAKFRGLSHCL